MNFNLLKCDIEDLPQYEFKVLPPSKRDVDAVDIDKYDLSGDALYLSMQDPCPCCGGFNMTVGDYSYLGCCAPCYGEEYRLMHEEIDRG